MSMMDAIGVMPMQQQESVSVPARGKVEFKPCGLHVILINLTQDMQVGDTNTLTLIFENAGSVEIQVPVRAP